MKNKRNFHLTISIICLAFAIACAVIYGVWKDDNVRFLSAIGFTACACIFLKMLFEFLRDIRFGRKLFAPLRKLFAKLYKNFTSKILGKDEDKIYLESKKDEFQIKFEMFRHAPKAAGKKAPPRLPKYSSLKTDRERVRHIYTAFLKKKEERGYNVKSALTPNEISADFAGNEKAELLFKLYPAARYGAENEPCEADIKKLEDLM
ncbi:MAG: hypothetical protein IJX27_02165 [Clostridia bacterium]|nr:hypothetical protein [Clostridia bacterium]